jgi:hypothetical protein
MSLVVSGMLCQFESWILVAEYLQLSNQGGIIQLVNGIVNYLKVTEVAQ